MTGSRLRVGAVNYLNTKPLVYRLDRVAGPAGQVVFDLPSRLADELPGPLGCGPHTFAGVLPTARLSDRLRC